MKQGTGLTREMALHYAKPCMVLPLDEQPDPDEFNRWLVANNIRSLNIGGPRESDEPGCVYDVAQAHLRVLFGVER